MKIFDLTCVSCGRKFESVANRTKYCDTCRKLSEKGFIHELWYGKWVYVGAQKAN